MGGLDRAPQTPHAPRPGAAVALRERGSIVMASTGPPKPPRSAPRRSRGAPRAWQYREVPGDPGGFLYLLLARIVMITGARPATTMARPGSAASAHSDSEVRVHTSTASVVMPSGRSSSVA